MLKRASAVAVLSVAVALTALALDFGMAKTQQRAADVAAANQRSTILQQDEVVIFDTAARLDATGRQWIVPLHAWVYEPEKSKVRMAIAEKVVAPALGISIPETKRALFEERLDLLLSDNKGGRRVVVAVAGKTYTLAKTHGNGHAEGEVRIPRAQAEAAARDGVLEVRVLLREGDARVRKGLVHLLGPTGLSVISDIDDTVKITNVTDTQKMLEATFLEPFAPVPGMAEVYAAWRRPGEAGRVPVTAIHFVSSSPWHLYRPLQSFLDQAGFPGRTVSLKMIRLKDKSILNIFKNGSATKPPAIEALLEGHPERSFILVGDNGEEDPETYGAIARKYPGRIKAIYIRVVPEKPQSREDPRFAEAFEGVAGELWHLFRNAQEIERLP